MIDADLDRLMRAISSLDEDLALEFSESLLYLSEVFESRRVSDAKKGMAISGIAKHISKRAAAIDPKKAAEAMGSLRNLRNELMHGKLSKRHDFSRHYARLWDAISRAAQDLHASDVENLLAYSMSVSNLQLAEQGVSASKVATSYKKAFQSLSAEEKRRAFVEVLLTFFSDKRFLSALDRKGL